jgi:hypothetical protein
MIWRLVVVSMLLLVIETGCPHTWGRGGTIDRAMERDLQERLRQQRCNIGPDKWLEICSEPEDWEPLGCPRACQFEYP